MGRPALREVWFGHLPSTFNHQKEKTVKIPPKLHSSQLEDLASLVLESLWRLFVTLTIRLPKPKISNIKSRLRVQFSKLFGHHFAKPSACCEISKNGHFCIELSYVVKGSFGSKGNLKVKLFPNYFYRLRVETSTAFRNL
jgi:hypothetical protein